MPKIVDHNQKREELLTGCFGLWARRGYSAVTMREIAKTLKVSTGTLYHYFQNKEELFIQMVSWLGERDIENASQLVRQGHSLSQKIELLFQYIHQEQSYFQQLLLIAVDYYRHHPQSLQDNGENVLARVLSSYRTNIQQELQLPSDATANLLLNTLLGMVLQSIMAPQQTQWHEHSSLMQQLISSLGFPSIPAPAQP